MSKPYDFSTLDPPRWGAHRSAVLRLGESTYVRSPYAVEANPWVAREEWETLLLLRGAIVASFGQVETALAELAIRFSRDERCAAFRDSYPHALGKRLSYLRACFDVEPYRRRRGLAYEVFKQFEASAELRHVMAHSSVRGPSFGWLITFRDVRPTCGGGIALRDHRYRFSEIEQLAAKAARLSRRVQHLAAAAMNGWLPALDPDVDT